MMTDWLVTALWTTSIAIAAVLLLRRPVTGWLGAGAAYGLWLVVPLQLLATLPFFASMTPTPVELPVLVVTNAPGTAEALATGGNALNWLLIAWLAGSTLMLGHLAARILAARNLVAGSRPLRGKITMPPGTGRFSSERICVSRNTETPLVAGLLRPFILLPPKIVESLPASTMQLVIAHELRHAKRHDNLANLCAGLLLSLFWFNPLAWAAYRAFRSDQELSCDASVLAGLRSADRARYGHALLNLSGPRNLAAFATPWGQTQTIQRRIAMLGKHRQSSFRRAAGTLLVVLATGLAVTVSAGTAGSNVSATSYSNSGPESMVEVLAVAVSGGAAGSNSRSGRALTDPEPIVRIQPAYPGPAAEEEIEGHVKVEFTITEDGATEDIVFLEVEPEGVFEQSAIDAVSQWHFRPATEDGTPVPVRVIQTLEYETDPVVSIQVPEASGY